LRGLLHLRPQFRSQTREKKKLKSFTRIRGQPAQVGLGYSQRLRRHLCILVRVQSEAPQYLDQCRGKLIHGDTCPLQVDFKEVEHCLDGIRQERLPEVIGSVAQ
jgi:hypothetical protein